MVTPATGFENGYTYTGREWDKETGLYYYRARYFDPMEGRFIAKDPISFAGGDVNLYGYVGNNVINKKDPSGLSVYICAEKADIPLNDIFELPHLWLKTGTKSMGLGPAVGDMAGGMPYITETAITDHSNRKGICQKLPSDVDEGCVNNELQKNKAMGKWTSFNNCWTLVNNIVEKCRNRCLK
jgi:RHS repeat-associated protein